MALKLSLTDDNLDPTDWESFRATCHEILDQCIDYVRDVRSRPAWTPVPEHVKAAIQEAAPNEGQGLRKTFDNVADLVLPYPTGNIHPCFSGWVHGTGTVDGMMAELMSAAMNCNVGGREHSAVYVERQVVSWFAKLFGFPPTTSGLIVTGTSMANLIGIDVALHAKAGFDVRENGLWGADCPLIAYASQQAHGSVSKALELLGCGKRSLSTVRTAENLGMDVDDLEWRIQEDLQNGQRPFCVIGTVGTAGTGAIDDLERVSEVCRKYGLWLHVDGAYGALAILSPEKQHLLNGIDRADSLAFDFHKWLHVPYDCGCILVRDHQQHLATFQSSQVYLQREDRGLAAGAPWFCHFGPELSRGFRALKVWVQIKSHGLKRLGAMITKNCSQAVALADLICRHEALQVLSTSPLSIVCFRYFIPQLAEEELDVLNREIVIQLQVRGIAAPSTTSVRGVMAIRVCITNHRTEMSDLERLVEHVVIIGSELVAAERTKTAQTHLTV
jgi:aromatic-L-amino-acid decarboxylase